MPYLRSIMVDQWYKIKRRKTARSRIDVSFLATFFENSKQRDEGTYRAAFGASSYREHSVFFLINRREKKNRQTKLGSCAPFLIFSLIRCSFRIERFARRVPRLSHSHANAVLSQRFRRTFFPPPALLSDDHQTTIIAKSRVPSILPPFFFCFVLRAYKKSCGTLTVGMLSLFH